MADQRTWASGDAVVPCTVRRLTVTPTLLPRPENTRCPRRIRSDVAIGDRPFCSVMRPAIRQRTKCPVTIGDLLSAGCAATASIEAAIRVRCGASQAALPVTTAASAPSVAGAPAAVARATTEPGGWR
jgi:hypothetical protein